MPRTSQRQLQLHFLIDPEVEIPMGALTHAMASHKAITAFSKMTVDIPPQRSRNSRQNSRITPSCYERKQLMIITVTSSGIQERSMAGPTLHPFIRTLLGGCNSCLVCNNRGALTRLLRILLRKKPISDTEYVSALGAAIRN